MKLTKPSFGINKALVGKLIAASVIRALIFGVQTRQVAGPTIRKWQCLLPEMLHVST